MKKKSNMMNSLSLLYFLFILMLIQMSYLMYTGDNQSIFVFAIIVFITYLVFPNMIFVLGVSLISINLLISFRCYFSYEGMENKDDSVDDELKKDCTDFKKHVYKKINDALKDSSSNDIPKNALTFCKKVKQQYADAEKDYDFYKYYIDNFNDITDNLDIDWINTNIYDSANFKYIYCNVNDKKLNMPQHIQDSFNKDNFKENMIEEDTSDPNHISNVMERLQKNTPEMIDSLKILNSLDMKQVNDLINNLNTIAGSFNKITSN